MQIRRSIFFRITFLTWILIITTLAIFIFSTIPYQKEVLIERMHSEAKDIASSISQVTATAIIAEDYSFTLEHCLSVVQESNSILYTVITKKDGFSLIIKGGGWSLDTLHGKWNKGDEGNNDGGFIFEDLIEEDVFYYKHPFSYSGIEWGWIHIGLSLRKYNAGIKELYVRTFTSSLIGIVIGFVASIYFGKKISKPIHHLNEATQKVTRGDLTVRSDVNTGDEIEGLSVSFNKMTEALNEAQTNFGKKVDERTAELAESNIALEGEIIERKRGEELLQTSLTEKEILLKEIHHRVKNNLQIISSLLYLQGRRFDDIKIKNIFNDSQTRVKSMSLVHEKLYQSKTLSHIDLKEYIQNLTSYIFNYYTNTKKVKLVLDAENIKLNIDTAVPCGLVINELVTNSLKYAFPDEHKEDNPQISVSIKKQDGLKYLLEISDNGVGIPKDFNIKASDSLGLQLVNSLVAQIEGKINVSNEIGTKFLIDFIDRDKIRTEKKS